MKSIIQMIEALLADGWDIDLQKTEFGYQSYAQRGDFNCRYRKEYDPKTKHGFSQVWAETFDSDDSSDTLEISLKKLYDLCMKVVPGEKYLKSEKKK